jgi:hypothetical protein
VDSKKAISDSNTADY